MSERFPLADLHMHTSLSPCGGPEATPTVMLRAARELQLSALGFTDHYTPYAVQGCPFYNDQDERVLEALRAELGEAPAGLDVLIGVEADYTVLGESSVPTSLLSRVDYVVIAASHFQLPATPQPSNRQPRAIAEHALAFSCAAAVMPGVSILAHPFSCSTLLPLPPITDTLSDAELGGLAELARDHQVALEINGGAGTAYATYKEGVTRFLRIAKETGARFTLCSDAHHPGDLARIHMAADWAREVGLREGDLLSPAELRVWHKVKARKLELARTVEPDNGVL